MAKKSSSHKQRQGQAARNASNRAQTGAATLVRATKPDAADAGVGAPVNAATPSLKPSSASIVRDTPTTPAKPSPKPTAAATSPTRLSAKAPAPAAKPTAPAPAAARRQDTRVARARATQRARQAGLISAENYGYVLQDLKLVAWLAGGALVLLIVLTFVLPH